MTDHHSDPKPVSGAPPTGGSHVPRLTQITDQLLRLNNPEELYDAAAGLHALLAEITGIGAGSDAPGDLEHSLLPYGKAISPLDAASCVLDAVRTAKFLRGVQAALLSAQRRFPNTTIQVLYAGCGPYATLAVPLAARFKPGQIQFTLLDIHSRSLESAQKLFRAFGLETYLGGCVQADAGTYVHPGALHVVIAECMQRALTKEPQVAITRNLAPQLPPGGIFIPEQISVDACFANPGKEFLMPSAGPGGAVVSPQAAAVHRDRIKLGRIFELTSASADAVPAGNRLPAVRFDFPTGVGPGMELMLVTTIRVFELIVLDEYESALTQPVLLFDFNAARCISPIEFSYVLGDRPGFEFEWASLGERHAGRAV